MQETATELAKGISTNLDNQIAYLSAILCIVVLGYSYLSQKSFRTMINKILDRSDKGAERIADGIDKIHGELSDIKTSLKVLEHRGNEHDRRISNLERERDR